MHTFCNDSNHTHDKGVALSGGHGIAWDGPFSKELKRLLEEAYAMGKTIAAVDHGPAALINAMNLKLGAPLERILFRKQACKRHGLQ